MSTASTRKLLRRLVARDPDATNSYGIHSLGVGAALWADCWWLLIFITVVGGAAICHFRRIVDSFVAQVEAVIKTHRLTNLAVRTVHIVVDKLGLWHLWSDIAGLSANFWGWSRKCFLQATHRLAMAHYLDTSWALASTFRSDDFVRLAKHISSDLLIAYKQHVTVRILNWQVFHITASSRDIWLL